MHILQLSNAYRAHGLQVKKSAFERTKPRASRYGTIDIARMNGMTTRLH